MITEVDLNMIMQLARLIDMVVNHQPFHRANAAPFLVQKGLDMQLLKISDDGQLILPEDHTVEWLQRLRVQVGKVAGNDFVNRGRDE